MWCRHALLELAIQAAARIDDDVAHDTKKASIAGAQEGTIARPIYSIYIYIYIIHFNTFPKKAIGNRQYVIHITVYILLIIYIYICTLLYQIGPYILIILHLLLIPSWAE